MEEQKEITEQQQYIRDRLSDVCKKMTEYMFDLKFPDEFLLNDFFAYLAYSIDRDDGYLDNNGERLLRSAIYTYSVCDASLSKWISNNDIFLPKRKKLFSDEDIDHSDFISRENMAYFLGTLFGAFSVFESFFRNKKTEKNNLCIKELFEKYPDIVKYLIDHKDATRSVNLAIPVKEIAKDLNYEESEIKKILYEFENNFLGSHVIVKYVPVETDENGETWYLKEFGFRPNSHLFNIYDIIDDDEAVKNYMWSY